MKSNFNVYHFFAGAFVPFWLLSRQGIGAGAKLAYAALAQQANSRGAVQLHFRVQADSLGEDEGRLSRHLMELEEVGLIQVSRGNVSQEDIRVFFPPHSWMASLEQRLKLAPFNLSRRRRPRPHCSSRMPLPPCRPPSCRRVPPPA